MALIATACALLLLQPTADAARILGVFMTPSYSHQIVFQPIWKELSLRGHQVTVYTPSPLNDPSLTNLTEYDLSFSFEHMKQLKEAQYDAGKFFELFQKISESQLQHRHMQELLYKAHNQTFDLLLVEYLWQPYYAFKELYNVPMVGLTSLPLTIGAADALGMEKHPVVDPDLLLQFTRARTFKERVHSWLYSWLYRLAVSYKVAPYFDRQIRQYFGMNKSAAELAREVNLVIGNYNFALQNVKPITPQFVPISAIHVRPLQPLPPDLAEFMDNLRTEAIYFCLGTNVKSSEIAKNQLDTMLRVLGRLPYAVLWKYEDDRKPDNLPANFLVRKWFPQQDVLGHPKVKVFITQGGLQSIDEALCRKVPMLAVPFLGDQRTNTEKIVGLGIAEAIDFNNFSEEELEGKLRKLLSDPAYQKNLEKQSRIVTDQPISPLDSAVFWIEYVLRHDGADHLRYSAVDLPFYQYYLLDVYACAALTAAVLIAATRKLISGCFVTLHGLLLAKKTKIH